jgi:hypothetical protein
MCSAYPGSSVSPGRPRPRASTLPWSPVPKKGARPCTRSHDAEVATGSSSVPNADQPMRRRREATAQRPPRGKMQDDCFRVAPSRVIPLSVRRTRHARSRRREVQPGKGTATTSAASCAVGRGDRPGRRSRSLRHELVRLVRGAAGCRSPIGQVAQVTKGPLCSTTFCSIRAHPLLRAGPARHPSWSDAGPPTRDAVRYRPGGRERSRLKARLNAYTDV